MPTTQDYEYLLECKNVIGVDYDEREGFDALSMYEPVPEAAPGREDRHRPVPAGVSESNTNLTAGTGGPYPARVTDPDDGDIVWRDDVEPDDLVRLSNNHVYARLNEADPGAPILQPTGAIPVETTAFDHSVTVTLEEPSLALESIRFEDRVRPGETVAAAVSVRGEPGRYWLTIEDERTTVSIEVEAEDDSRGRATAIIPVSVPDDVDESLTVRVRGGRIEGAD